MLCADGNEVLESVYYGGAETGSGRVSHSAAHQSYTDKLGARNAVADDSARKMKN